MAWLQIRLAATAAQVPAIEDALFEAGAVSVTLGDPHDNPILEPGVGETPLWPEVTVTALFDAEASAPAAMARVEASVGEPLGAWQAESLADRAWEREWLQHFRPVRFGERFWVCPYEHAVDEPGAIVLRLDPGLAFGTGTHPTTALCLEWLATRPLAGLDIVDYGCGSGILGLAALLLGAARVRAVDIDPQALIATRDNAAKNAIEPERLELGDVELLDDDAPCAVLLANILAGPLVELAPRFARLLPAGGRAVLSGILSSQADAVCAAYAGSFALVEVTTRDDWCRIELERLPATATA